MCSANFHCTLWAVERLLAQHMQDAWLDGALRLDPSSQLWLSSGVRSYLALKALLDVGSLPIEEFIATANDAVLAPHYSSALRDTPNAEITDARLAEDPRLAESVRRRGFILGMYLELIIHKQTQGAASLGTLTQRLRARAEAADGVVTQETIVDEASRLAGRDLAPLFTSAITWGRWIDMADADLPELALKPREDGPFPVFTIVGEPSMVRKRLLGRTRAVNLGG